MAASGTAASSSGAQLQRRRALADARAWREEAARARAGRHPPQQPIAPVVVGDEEEEEAAATDAGPEQELNTALALAPSS